MPKKYIYIVIAVLVACLIAVCALTLALGREGGKSEEVYSPKLASDSYCVLVTGRDRASGLSDVIMLVSFDPSKSRICVLQIPRDTYALYGNGKYRKLNGAQRALGEDGFCGLLEDSLGIGIDGYVSLDLSGFRELVDLIGGVEIELDEPLRYTDSAQGLYIDLDSGRQTLDGKQAEMFVRYRSGYRRGDLDRLNAQKKFLAALFVALRQKVSISNAYELLQLALEHVDTNINPALCVTLGLEALKVGENELWFCTLPGEDIVSRKSGASFYVMSKRPVKRLLSEYFGAEGELDKDGIFLNGADSDFREIYQKDCEIEMICAGTLEKTKND
jgi:LCP family protein required for cell wall assembly